MPTNSWYFWRPKRGGKLFQYFNKVLHFRSILIQIVTQLYSQSRDLESEEDEEYEYSLMSLVRTGVDIRFIGKGVMIC